MAYRAIRSGKSYCQNLMENLGSISNNYILCILLSLILNKDIGEDSHDNKD